MLGILENLKTTDEYLKQTTIKTAIKVESNEQGMFGSSLDTQPVLQANECKGCLIEKCTGRKANECGISCEYIRLYQGYCATCELAWNYRTSLIKQRKAFLTTLDIKNSVKNYNNN